MYTNPTMEDGRRNEPPIHYRDSNGRSDDQYDNDPVKQYLDQIGRVDLLTRSDEINLAQRIKAGEGAEAELQREVEDPFLDREALVKAVCDGEVARKHMIEANLRLVVSIAKKYTRKVPGLDLLDLVQEGNIGLMKAVGRFDEKLGFRFSTYATWWIRQSIAKAIPKELRLIPVSAYIQQRLTSLTIVERDIKTEKGYVNDEEVCIRLGIGGEDLKELRRIQALGYVASLEQPIGEDSESFTLGDTLTDPSAAQYFEQIDSVDELQRLGRQMGEAGLTEREIEVLNLRSFSDMTLDEIGKEYGLTRERIRQIEAKARKKLVDYIERRERSSMG